MADIDTAVEYVELHGARREGWNQGRWQCTRAFRVRWEDRFRFAADALGSAQQIGDRVVYRLPARYPGLVVPTYVASTEIQPMGRSSNEPGYSDVISYEWAKVTLQYETPEFDREESEAQVYVEETWSGTVQFVTMPQGTYTYPSGDPVDSSQGKMMGTSELSLKIHQLPEIPHDLIEEKIGKVNASPFYNTPTHKILFSTYGMSRQYTSDGPTSWTLDLRFLRRSESWLKIVNPKTGLWEEITPPLFESTSLIELLPII